ncbi:DUF2198 family protein [Halalkalibacter akibai]|uniref:DUF2198 family protein n=1 Tax=Halalkalibacter akibai (strain ATCC 43226 / DSM 21942 / CIP 109018 / JCM 9157 / 1139) TaxID=1236973 RepID=W4QMF0_HALA3|nr:DUF2198 family protein [Halalkalibacter akibai]GAE33072.1 hypothetical protein JCM9157_58 [Halalkalibacter akibai JCM 9157]
MTDIVLALIVPFLIMVVTTRVTFSLLGACIVTWMVSLVVLPVQQQPWIIGIMIISFIAGLLVSRKRLKKKPGM